MSFDYPLDEARAYEAWRQLYRASVEQEQRLQPGEPPADRWGQPVPLRRFSPDETPQGLDRILEVLPPTSWPPPPGYIAPTVDVAFNFHVVYFVEEIGPFLDAMEAHSTARCVVVAGDRPGVARPRELFEAIHREPVIDAPAGHELISVLAARGAEYEVRHIPGADWKLEYDPLTQLRIFCLVREDTPQDQRLRDWLEARQLSDFRHLIQGRRMRPQMLITWTPGAPRA